MKCIICEDVLKGKQRRFCSVQCNSAYHSKQISEQRRLIRYESMCVECGRQIVKPKNSRAKYCSQECRKRRNNRVRRERSAKARAGTLCKMCGGVMSAKRKTRKFCSNKCKDDWKASNTDRWDRIEYMYRLSRENWEAMLISQNGACAICKEESDRWHTDHDHSCCPPKKRTCGKCVRGILCNRCNQAIGLLREKVEIFESAMEYLS